MYQNRIRDLREDADLSQRELAELLGVHQTTYSDYEPGSPVTVSYEESKPSRARVI